MLALTQTRADSKAGRGKIGMAVTTELLWQDMNTRLKKFIVSRVRDEQSAEDILQDVFLKVHTRIETLKNSEKLESWIYQVVRNAISDYYRAQRPTEEVPETVLAPQEEERDLAKELIPGVQAMIRRLPEDYQQALILTEYEGLTQRELAERLGISLSGAKSRVQRAREKLKAMLLDCCHFELDRRGHIIDFQPRCDCCSDGSNTGCDVS
jgi:RNA polymerase sigma-70 factor (ECF subfamily)